MLSILFYNGTYSKNAPVQTLNIEAIEKIFRFEYIESNLTQTLKTCIIPESITSHQTLNKPEESIAIHKTCSNDNINIGYGLIATSFIPNNTIISEFLGNREKMSLTTDKTYSLTVGNILINAKTKGNLLRFSVHLPQLTPKHLKEGEVKLANTQLITMQCTGEDHSFVLTKKDIEIGEEIGWDYGHKHWNTKTTYYINPKNGKCFPDIQSPLRLREKYSNIINEYQKDLERNPNDQIISQELAKTFLLRSHINIISMRHNTALKDSKSALEISPLSLANKAKSLQLMERILLTKLRVDIIIKYKGTCDSNPIKSQIKTIINSNDQAIEQIIGLFTNQAQCLQYYYSRLVSISEHLLPYTKKTVEIYTMEFAILKQEHDFLLNIMCNFKQYDNNICDYNNNIFNKICKDNDDIFQNCQSLIKLSEINIKNHDTLSTSLDIL